MKTKKPFNFKIFLLVITFFILQANVYPIIWANGAGGGYGEGEEGDSTLCSSIPIESYIVEGAGHFLDAYAAVLSFLNRVELSGEGNTDFSEWQELLETALVKMGRANTSLIILIWLAESTPYNEAFISRLKQFNYSQFMMDNGLNTEIFKAMAEYLQTGDITGVFKRMQANFGVIISRLTAIHRDVLRGKMPALASLWDLNQLCSDTLLLGQYVSRVCYAIN